MGLGIEDYELESTAASDIITNASGRLTNFDDTQIANNGTTVTDVLEVVNSPPSVMAEASSPSPSQETAKGKGLRKWRRIKRDVIQDEGTNLDSSKLLKRVLSNFAANLHEPVIFSAEVKQTSEGSVSSTNAMLRSFGTSVDSFGGIADSGLMIGPMLATETDSENSEDRSSKSTAASAPKMRQDGREKNKVKNISGKNLANSVHKGHQGKPRAESSKKARGELFQVEKENSHSSLESDSRSSHPVFVQGGYSATSNGIQNGMTMIYGGETSDEAPGVERELSEELQAGFSRQNAEFEVISDEKFVPDTLWAAKDDQSEDNGSSRDLDPLAESIMLLQSVQQELGKELQKFRDIGNEGFISEDLSEQLKCGEVVEDSSDILGSDIICLKETASSLRNKLDDTAALLKVKDTRIAELEGCISSCSLPGGERSSLLELDQVTCRDMELEFERLFEQKIEAEVEYLVITKTVQNMRVSVADQIKILKEQKSEQAQMLIKLEDAKYKAATLNGKDEKLKKWSKDIASAGETLKPRSSAWKYTTCFFLQLVLFAIILAVFMWQMSPYNADFVPT